MADIPPDLTIKLQAAEDALQAAKAKDGAVTGAQQALATAQTSLDGATGDALASHQAANQASSDFLAAFRAHFGL